MEETTIEIIIGILARTGIITAHMFDLIGGVHTVTIVIILWSLEEVISVSVAARRLHHNKTKGAIERHSLFHIREMIAAIKHKKAAKGE
jgi:TctA family transporter